MEASFFCSWTADEDKNVKSLNIIKMNSSSSDYNQKKPCRSLKAKRRVEGEGDFCSGVFIPLFSI